MPALILFCVLCDNCSAQGGELCSELTAPTPPPRRLRFGISPSCMSQASGASAHTSSGLPQRTRSFSRIASGLKLAQAQAMAVAGFLPDWQPNLTDANGNSSDGMHAPCSLLNHRASFHGRGQLLINSHVAFIKILPISWSFYVLLSKLYYILFFHHFGSTCKISS